MLNVYVDDIPQLVARVPVCVSRAAAGPLAITPQGTRVSPQQNLSPHL